MGRGDRRAWSRTSASPGAARKAGDIKTSGQVTFNELGHGQTEVTVTLQWVVPASQGGETLAGLFAAP